MKTLLGSMTILLAAAFAPLAQADIEITYSVDGGAAVTCGPAANGPISCSGLPSTPLNISTLSGFTNAPGTPSLSELTSATVAITNSTSATHTVVINVMSDTYTAPTAPATLLSHIGGTVAVGSANDALSFKSCVGGNNLTGCSGATFSSGTGAPSITGTGSFQSDQTGTVASLSSPYSIDEMITLTLGAGASVNFSASSTLTSVPEPASVFLLGGVLLGLAKVIRRKEKEIV